MYRKLLIYFTALFVSMAFFAVFMLIFLNGTQATCTQKADKTYTCTIQTLLFDRYSTGKKVVERIHDVDTFDDGCVDGCGYRTEFITMDGQTVPLTEVYTDWNPVEKQTSELHSLLTSGQPNFEYHRTPTWWVAYLIGGLFLMDFIILTALFGFPAIREYFANRDSLPQ